MDEIGVRCDAPQTGFASFCCARLLNTPVARLQTESTTSGMISAEMGVYTVLGGDELHTAHACTGQSDIY
jgi:hypothetical protein